MSEAVAKISMRLAALIRGGFTHQRALEQLAQDDGEHADVMRRLNERIHTGTSAGEAMVAEPDEAWKLLAATWHIAEHTGSPAATALERMSDALSRLESLRRRREVLLAGPKGSVLLIASLPFLAIIVGELLGIHVAAQLATPFGLVLLGVGTLLLTMGVAWGLAMIRAVQKRDHAAGCELDLMWIALAGASTPDRARRTVIETVDRFDVAWVNLDAFGERGEATMLLDTARTSGVRLRDLVTLEADTLRERTHRDLEREAERLAVRILIPLGLCVLPAFICIGVIPLLLGML